MHRGAWQDLAGLRTRLIDGELVVETAEGASDFSALQADLSDGRSDRFRFYGFDLLHLDGYRSECGAALVERKAIARAAARRGRRRPELSLQQRISSDGGDHGA
jgi:ATP-dependent DNA ligase